MAQDGCLEVSCQSAMRTELLKQFKVFVLQRDEIEDVRESNNLQEILDLKDKRMPDWPDVLWKRLFDLGLRCIQARKKSRPAIEQVRSCFFVLCITNVIPW